MFGGAGLRTVSFAYKFFSNAEIEAIIDKIQSAKNSPINVEGRIDQIYNDIEMDSCYLGTAGIEDYIS